ncbi:MAG: hypothetical protein QM756_11070 [Polyangiaceae bacterium]
MSILRAGRELAQREADLIRQLTDVRVERIELSNGFRAKARRLGAIHHALDPSAQPADLESEAQLAVAPGAVQVLLEDTISGLPAGALRSLLIAALPTAHCYETHLYRFEPVLALFQHARADKVDAVPPKRAA